MAQHYISFERGATCTFEISVAASTTGDAITGKAKSDFNISKDGAAFAALNASSTVTELANGVYIVVLHASTDATCDRFCVCYVTAGSAVSCVMGQSQWSFSKVRINSSISTVDGSVNPTDAPLVINNTSATAGAACVYMNNAGTSIGAANVFMRAAGTTHGSGIYFYNVQNAIKAFSTNIVDGNWILGAALNMEGTPGATGGKLISYATLGGTAPTGPLIDFGASVTAAKLIDWTSTPASSAPVVRIISGGAGPAVELKNTSTGPALKVYNSGTGDAALFLADGSAGYSLNLDMGTAGAFGMRLDGMWPETTGAVTGLDFFGAVGRVLSDALNTHSLNVTSQTQTTKKRDGTTTLHTRTVTDDGTTQTIGAVS